MSENPPAPFPRASQIGESLRATNSPLTAPRQPTLSPAAFHRCFQSPRGFFLAPVRVSRHAGAERR